MRSLRVLLVFGMIAATSFAGVAPRLVSVSASSDGAWEYSYEMVLSAGTKLTGAGVGMVTLYDVRGFVPGSQSCSGPLCAVFQASSAMIGPTPAGVAPTDDPAAVNLAWTYRGGSDLAGETVLGLFKYRSSRGPSTQLGMYAGTAVKATEFTNVTPVSVVGFVAGPGETNTGIPVNCDDFVTGGGQATTGPGRIVFAMTGGIKHGAYWGNLTYSAPGVSLRSVRVKSYRAGATPFERIIVGDGELNGRDVVEYRIVVADGGEPARQDSLQVSLKNGYTTPVMSIRGNLQLHDGACVR